MAIVRSRKPCRDSAARRVRRYAVRGYGSGGGAHTTVHMRCDVLLEAPPRPPVHVEVRAEVG